MLPLLLIAAALVIVVFMGAFSFKGVSIAYMMPIGGLVAAGVYFGVDRALPSYNGIDHDPTLALGALGVAFIGAFYIVTISAGSWYLSPVLWAVLITLGAVLYVAGLVGRETLIGDR